MPFKPGQSGNPGGRIAATLVRSAILAAVQEEDPKKRRTRLAAIVGRLVAKAEKGDIDAAREIFNRLDGKPIETQRLEGDNVTRYVVFVPVRVSDEAAWEAEQQKLLALPPANSAPAE